MKESTLLEMQNKIKALTNVVQHLMNENTQLRDLAVGTLETLKLMDGYEEAIEKLKESLTKKEGKKDGVIEQDTK
jgi:regulator of replication initiation timing